MRTLVRHRKSRKLGWFHRVEQDIEPGEHSSAIAGIIALVGLFIEHKCGVVIECPQGSKFWPDHLAPHFIDKGFRALGSDWSNHCRTATSHRDQLVMHVRVDPLVRSAVGPDCASIDSFTLLRRWYGSSVVVWVVVTLLSRCCRTCVMIGGCLPPTLALARSAMARAHGRNPGLT